MTLKLQPFVLGVLIFGLLLLFFLLIRGCYNSKSQVLKASVLKLALDSLVQKNKSDSIAFKENKDRYDNSLAYANGVIDLRNNQLQFAETNLLSVTYALTDLRKKHENVKPRSDTSVTLVPNEFINDCHGCFESLEFQKKLVSLYVQEVKGVDSAHLAKEKLQESRIGELTLERNAYRQNSNDAIAIAGRAQDALKPRSKVLFSIGVLWAPLPRAVGAGIVYQDKRGRQFGAKAYASRWGALGETEVSLPLSFKR